jgi:hypothetical protein
MKSPGLKSFALRGIHALVVLLAITATGTAIFAITSIAGLNSWIPDSVENVINLALPWLIPICTVGAIWKNVSYRFALPLLGVSGSWLLYLAWDISPPTPSMVMPQCTPQDSKSWTTYRWLLKSGPDSRVNRVPSGQADLPFFPVKREEWAGFVLKNRTVFEVAWLEDTLGREWIETMALYSPEGIYPTGAPDAPGLSFAVIRRATQIRWACAQLLLLDGKADEAAHALLPLLRTGYHLQKGGTSLLNQMIASACVKGTYERLELIAESGSVPAPTRAAVVAALREAPPVTSNIALVFLGEDISARSFIARVQGEYAGSIESVASTDSQPSTNRILGRFLFNPRKTEHEYVTFLADCNRLAQERQFSALSQVYTEFDTKITVKKFKNPAGKMLTAMMLPAFTKTIERFWKAEDQRLALLKRFAQ